MSDEDKTLILPESEVPADKITKPGVEAILDRINSLGDELRVEIRQLREELRKEMNEGFDLINRKLSILASEDLNRRAEIEKIRDRIADLERKAS
jgi:hypothetical protein